VSRIGKLPIPLPKGVECQIAGQRVTLKGPKGALTHEVHPSISVALADGEITVKRPNDTPEVRALHGLTRALLMNMAKGVSEGYQRVLQIEGVGYRAALQGKNLNLSVGYSHPVSVAPPPGITFEMDGTQTIKISGIDKQQVGQVAANIRKIRGPEPYKGKGIRYSDEQIRRKEGKTGGK
jgi:large subunit ribosomal protein L6